MISLCCSAAVSTQYEQRTLEYEAVRAAHLNRYSRTHHAIRLCATPAQGHLRPRLSLVAGCDET